MPVSVTVTVSSAAETMTPSISPAYKNEGANMNLSIEADSAWTGTIRLQRKLPTMSTWEDVETWNDDAQEEWNDTTPGALYRIGSLAGDQSAGTAIARLIKQYGYGRS